MEILLTGILVFVSTNIDDIFILMLFFGDKKYKARDIYIGQYLGMILLIALSLAAALLGSFIDSKYIGLLGLFPIYLGLRQLFTLFKGRNKIEEPDLQKIKSSKSGILTVAAVTVANGGDNLGVYIPFFVTLTTADKTITIALFLVMVLVWLVIAKYLSLNPAVAKVISKYGYILTPIILCLLGLFILKENGSFDLLK